MFVSCFTAYFPIITNVTCVASAEEGVGEIEKKKGGGGGERAPAIRASVGSVLR